MKLLSTNTKRLLSLKILMQLNCPIHIFQRNFENIFNTKVFEIMLLEIKLILWMYQKRCKNIKNKFSIKKWNLYVIPIEWITKAICHQCVYQTLPCRFLFFLLWLQLPLLVTKFLFFTFSLYIIRLHYKTCIILLFGFFN